MYLYSDKVMEHFQNPQNMGQMEDPDVAAKVGNPSCVVPQTSVHASRSLRPIEGLYSGEEVLGHKGEYEKIKATTSGSYNGKLFRIENRLGSEYLTPDHMVRAIKVPNSLEIERSKPLTDMVAWHHAIELNEGDIVVYPAPERDIEATGVPKKLKRERAEKSDDRPISSKYVQKVEAFFNELSMEDIQDEFFYLPSKIQKYLIRKLWQMDALFRPNNEKNVQSVCAVGPYEFIHKLKILFLGQGIIPSINKRDVRNPDDSQYEGSNKGSGQELQGEMYEIRIEGNKSLKRLSEILDEPIDIEDQANEEMSDIGKDVSSWIEEGNLYMPIKKIETKNYEGRVNNIEVENSRSFVSGSLSLHNCGDLMEIYIKIGENESNEKTIKDIKFKTFGCAAAIATSSVTTEMVKGKTLDEAEQVTNKEVAESLGGLPSVKMHCSNLAASGVHKAIYKYKKENGMEISNDLEAKYKASKRDTEDT